MRLAYVFGLSAGPNETQIVAVKMLKGTVSIYDFEYNFNGENHLNFSSSSIIICFENFNFFLAIAIVRGLPHIKSLHTIPALD